MGRKYFKQRGKEKNAALERIKVLFALARQEHRKNPDRANRYARMILDLVKKIRVRLPSDIKRFICKECSHLLTPGINLKVESKKGFMYYTCLDCGNVKKFGYLKEKKRSNRK